MAKSGIEVHILPPTSGAVATNEHHAEVVEALGARPDVGLLFVAPGMYWGRREGHLLEREIVSAFGEHFSDKLIAVGCNECLLDDGGLLSCDGPRGTANGTLGLFLNPTCCPRSSSSSSSSLRVRVACDDAGAHRYTEGVHRYLVPDFVEDFAEELGLDDDEPNSCLVVFANSFPPLIPTTSNLFGTLQRKCERKQLSLWGGYVNDDISVAEHDAEGRLTVKDSFYVVLRLSGETLRSWSTVVKCNQTRSAIDEELGRFRRSLTLRRRSVLLVSGPASPAFDREDEAPAYNDRYASCEEFAQATKRVFAEVPTIGAFGNQSCTIGIDSALERDKRQQRFLRNNCMSLMVLSFD